jgi:Fe2+ transport system protein B
MDGLIELLDNSADLYSKLLELEYRKYDTIIKNDIEQLDEIVSEEQVFYLKIRGLEQKREKLVESMGYKDKTISEIIEAVSGEEKEALLSKFNEASKTINEVKRISSLCKTLIEVRMKRIGKILEDLGEKDNTYSMNTSSPEQGKSLLFSKKI